MLIEVIRDGRPIVTMFDRLRPGPFFLIDPEGWPGWPAPAVKRDNSERESAHGSHHLPTYLGDSAAMVTGHALAGSELELAQLRRELMRCYPGEVVLQVTDGMGTLWADAALTQAPTFRTLPSGGERREARFEIEFWLPDPWKYGPAKTLPLAGAVEVVNRGEQDSWPVIRVSGPTNGVSISANGREKRINRALSSGQWMELDCRRDIVTLWTGARLGVESSGLPIFLRPGVNVVSVEGGSGSITVTETYI